MSGFWNVPTCSDSRCYAGWIDSTITDHNGRPKDVTSPCPTCRPEQADRFGSPQPHQPVLGE